MIRWKQTALLIIALAILCAALAFAQAQKSGEPGRAIVSIYHVAPGKHLDFLKWMAAREPIDKEAGVAPTQWYVHTDGDSWDFVAIAPQTTEAEDKKLDDLAAKKGLKTGFAAALELRQFLTSHTDTFARGPGSAADLVNAAGGN